ncbi:microcephalin [Megalopta genalis]|uniref:microcephalin n=1 Tax=Megalopta genalis TaxID=115081 RepID=UPI003FD6175C
MSSNKNEITIKRAADEGDRIKHQRTSLAVNLSCSSNLTDSGNGSLKQINIECNDNPSSPALISNTTQRNKRYRNRSFRDRQVSVNNTSSSVHHDILSNQVSVVLERIENDAECLDKSCEILKQVILTKTKQMFDMQNELSVKTEAILSKSLNQRIDTTPKDKHRNKNLTKQRKQFTFNKRRLFENKLNIKVHSNVNVPVQSNQNLDISNLSTNISSAPILADEREENKTNCTVASKDKYPSNLNVSDDSIFAAVPIGCSTMIHDETSDKDQEPHSNINEIGSHYVTNKDAIPMDITNIQQVRVLCNNGNSLITKQGSKSQFSYQRISVEEHSAKTTQSSLAVNTSTNGLDKDNRHKRSICSTILGEAEQNTNIISTSLQMNTSLDVSNKLCSRGSNISREMLKLNSTVNKNNDTKKEVDGVNIVEMESSKHQETKNNEPCRDPSNVIALKDKIIINEVQGSQSYVEATPYPTCRSVLLKTQLQQNMKQNTSKEYRKSCSEQETRRSKSIILDNSSLNSYSKPQKSIIINESTDDSELSKIQVAKNFEMPPPTRKSKKRLLPLRESSQLLTFSPMENENLLPGHLGLKNRCKKRKKQHENNKLTAVDKHRNVEHINGGGSDRLELGNNSVTCDTKVRQKKPRKVMSKKIIVKQLAGNDDILRRLKENSTNVTQSCISNRNSLNDFQSLNKQSSTRSRMKKAQRINIVMTGLCNDDKNIVKSVVKSLGHAKIESNVTKRTTHVVTTGVRTINLLHGIIRGCWLVSLEWVLKSLENSAWLNPEEYEMTHFSKAVLENRKDRQLFGTAYVPELFAACGQLYIGKGTTPPYNVLKDLIKTAGGHITERPEAAKIIIDAKGLKETWVLDCITTGELQPFDQYRRS